LGVRQGEGCTQRAKPNQKDEAGLISGGRAAQMGGRKKEITSAKKKTTTVQWGENIKTRKTRREQMVFKSGGFP